MCQAYAVYRPGSSRNVAHAPSVGNLWEWAGDWTTNAGVSAVNANNEPWETRADTTFRCGR